MLSKAGGSVRLQMMIIRSAFSLFCFSLDVLEMFPGIEKKKKVNIQMRGNRGPGYSWCVYRQPLTNVAQPVFKYEKGLKYDMNRTTKMVLELWAVKQEGTEIE